PVPTNEPPAPTMEGTIRDDRARRTRRDAGRAARHPLEHGAHPPLPQGPSPLQPAAVAARGRCRAHLRASTHRHRATPPRRWRGADRRRHRWQWRRVCSPSGAIGGDGLPLRDARAPAEYPVKRKEAALNWVASLAYLANSMMRVSRITVTLIWPG